MEQMNEFKVTGTVEEIGGCCGEMYEAIMYLCVSSSLVATIIGIEKGVSIKNIKVGDTVTLVGVIKGNGLVATEINSCLDWQGEKK